MKQQVLVCFLVVVLVSLVNGAVIDLSKSIEDVEYLLENLRNLDNSMKRSQISSKSDRSCRDASDCGQNPGRPAQMCHVPDIANNCPSMCNRKCGSDDKLDQLISFLRKEVDDDK